MLAYTCASGAEGWWRRETAQTYLARALVLVVAIRLVPSPRPSHSSAPLVLLRLPALLARRRTHGGPMTPRYRLARWNLLAAQAHLDVTMARVNRKPVEALVLWAEICEMRRTQAQEDCSAP